MQNDLQEIRIEMEKLKDDHSNPKVATSNNDYTKKLQEEISKAIMEKPSELGAKNMNWSDMEGTSIDLPLLTLDDFKIAISSIKRTPCDTDGKLAKFKRDNRIVGSSSSAYDPTPTYASSLLDYCSTIKMILACGSLLAIYM
ncbi:hypothetical protein WR25_13241 [Diploscapter pachys]|uniref:Spastin/Vps4 C-terminal domain-containing protein n=1 Tax=Diploscapter pachys TaxID=2018661 RepID=A0A2A2KWS6_9BILA|nr:hypothetical protein WR25_13241 [Diploscapter pachys]